MRNNLLIEQVQATKTYQKSNRTVRKFLEERTVRAKMTHAYQVFLNTGKIPNTVSSYYLEVVQDIINSTNNIEVDYNTIMSCENLNLDQHER